MVTLTIEASTGYKKKKKSKNLSLSFGEAGGEALGRSPGLGFILLAAPSHPSA
jgi:hypothetical protein